MCRHLREWIKGNRKDLKFGIPMVWREPGNHIDDCYFCIVKGGRPQFQLENQIKNTVSQLRFSHKPIPHSDQLPVSVFTNFHDDSDENVVGPSSEASASLTSDEEFVSSQADSKARLPFSQADLNDLVQNLDFPKNAAELLASR